MQPLIKFQDVYRDGIQSLLGTNPSADEIIAAYSHTNEIGLDSIQTNGGTFFDLFAKKGRNEWEEIEKIATFFKEKNMKQSALIRGDFLFSYEPQSYDVIRATVFEYAKMGINILQNFHGMNDARCLVGVAKAVKEAQEAGHDIVAQGAICIEDNPNVTVENCLKFTQELVDMGHEGFYLKSASGHVDPDFVYELTTALYERFPEQDITLHVHATYGKAPACYMKAAEAATSLRKPITLDVQHPALAESTAHPCILKMLELIEDNPIQSISENAPKINKDAIEKDMNALERMRYRYNESESTYDYKILKAMENARVPGGASSTLRGIIGLEDRTAHLLGTTNWNKIQTKIYEMQAEILEDLGHPTQVTPYALNTTNQAVLCLWNELQGLDRYHQIHPSIVSYLTGKHGRVPDTVNKKLQAQTLKIAGLKKPVEYVPSTERPDVLPDAKNVLIEVGIENPTDRQAISTVLLDRGIDHVVACHNGTNKPQQRPKLPEEQIRDEERLKAIGGYGTLQKFAQKAVFLKQLNDKHYIFPEGMEYKNDEWRQRELKTISEFLDYIPTQFQKAEIKGFKDSSPSMVAQHALAIFSATIQKTCDKKGHGIYYNMMTAADGYRKENLSRIYTSIEETKNNAQILQLA